MTAENNGIYERMFFQALRIRKIEEKIAEIYPEDKIQSPIHLSIGQEHIPVAICQDLNKSDLVFGTYRGHALYLAKGGDLKGMMAELFGKANGCGKGKAGSMHFSEPSVGMMGASAIVASTIPHAVGAALAAKVLNKDQINICFFGEGATGEGVYHESLNFASKFEIPVLFVCENNDLSIYNKVSEMHSFKIDSHARSYGIKTETIENGYDLQRLYDVGKACIAYVKKETKPVVLEIKTYRYRQHVGPNEDYDLGYRSINTLREKQELDPLEQNQELIQKFKKEINEEIQEALLFAEKSPFPSKEDLLLDVI